jgi:NADPH-dependent 2,4-dienoyl-CoA reductase/sulfur reductase-like enzyme/rhodanese-related sulfurtransferase
MKIVIVGGVAGGASAAAKARRVNEAAEIIVLEKGPYVSFANCGLPYYVGGDIKRKKKLLLVTPELYKNRFNIDVRVGHEVVDIDPRARTVQVRTAAGMATETYDKLILATGGEPVRPPIPGIDLANVFTVFTVDEAEAIAASFGGGVRSAVIVGGGYIGLETAEALLKRGVRTTLVEQLPQLIIGFDPEFSLPVERHLQELGLNLLLGKTLKAIHGGQAVTAVELADGTRLDADIVIVAAGVRPRLELARKAGLAIGEAGGVVVDAAMRTSQPDIYAAGDIVESLHLVSGKKVRIPLAGSAVKQGRVAGANAAGGSLFFKGVLGTAIAKVGELTVASTGLSEKEARRLGMNYYVAYSPTPDHAAYYPGAKRLILKLVIEQFTGRILGAQGVGFGGVDKRIDVLSTAIYGRLTVFDLENLDLAYAPPYGAARDPVIMAGMIAANILRGDSRQLTPDQLRAMSAEHADLQIVDVRTAKEYKRLGAMPGARSLPLDKLRKRYRELDPVKPTVVYCKVGYRSNVAYRFLLQKGFDVYNLSGGYDGYNMVLKA